MDDNMQIVNLIEIEGKAVKMDTLDPEEKKKIAELLQERLMTSAGFRRRSA